MDVAVSHGVPEFPFDECLNEEGEEVDEEEEEEEDGVEARVEGGELPPEAVEARLWLGLLLLGLGRCQSGGLGFAHGGAIEGCVSYAPHWRSGSCGSGG